MATKEKNVWLLMVFLLSGLVLGGLLGELAILDLTVLKITFGVTFTINIASIIGMTIAVLIYRKV